VFVLFVRIVCVWRLYSVCFCVVFVRVCFCCLCECVLCVCFCVSFVSLCDLCVVNVFM